MDVNIDYDKLRKDLIDYYGTAMSFNPIALMELSEVEHCSNQKLIEIALKNRFDLSKYIEKNKTYNYRNKY